MSSPSPSSAPHFTPVEDTLEDPHAALARIQDDLQVLAGKLTETEWRVDEHYEAANLAEAELYKAISELAALREERLQTQAELQEARSTVSAQAQHITRLRRQTARPFRLLVKKAVRVVRPGRGIT